LSVRSIASLSCMRREQSSSAAGVHTHTRRAHVLDGGDFVA
jgi:hypothetical protein